MDEEEGAVVVLKCADCGYQSESVEVAEKHVEITRHTNFTEIKARILNLICSTCGRRCTSKDESELHTQRSGHGDFLDKTSEGPDLEKAILEHIDSLRNARALRALTSDGEQESRLRVQVLTKVEFMRMCLEVLKKEYKDDAAKVETALETLYTLLRNVALKPDEEKFRKIRLANVNFQNRVGKLVGGIQFLEMCNFERVLAGEYLILPRDKVDMELLSSAGIELKAAQNQPFFGFI